MNKLQTEQTGGVDKETGDKSLYRHKTLRITIIIIIIIKT